MCHSNNEKRKITNDGRNKTTKSRKNQNTRRKETYKYLRILGADTIKQVKIKDKIKKNISGERENYLKINDIVEISSKR